MSDVKINGNVVVNETGMKLKDIAAGAAYAAPVKLYESPSTGGTYANFTLTDTIEHYDFFDVVYSANDGTTSIRNVHRFERSTATSSTYVTITYTWPNFNGGSSYVNYTKALKLVFNGNSVAYGPCAEHASGGGSASGSTNIHIIAVYGYTKGSNTNYVNTPTDSHIQSLISLLENYTPPEQQDVLYDDPTGTAGTVSLSKSIYNYDRVKIYGWNGAQPLLAQEFKIKSTTSQLQISYTINGNGIVYPEGTVYNVAAQQLTVAYHYRAGIYGANIGYQSTVNNFYVTKVIGIKELTPSSFPTQPQIQTLINLLQQSNVVPRYLKITKTTKQVITTNNAYVSFDRLDIDTTYGVLEKTNNNQVTVKSDAVHHIKVTANVWCESTTSAYSWFHIYHNNTIEACSMVRAPSNASQPWQTMTLTQIVEVQKNDTLALDVFYNTTHSSLNYICGINEFTGSSYIIYEVID